MTNPETIPDSIMQAAERLRRVNAGEDPADIYESLSGDEADDRHLLSEEYLHILPEEKRPKPIERPNPAPPS